MRGRATLLRGEADCGTYGIAIRSKDDGPSERTRSRVSLRTTTLPVPALRVSRRRGWVCGGFGRTVFIHSTKPVVSRRETDYLTYPKWVDRRQVQWVTRRFLLTPQARRKRRSGRRRYPFDFLACAYHYVWSSKLPTPMADALCWSKQFHSSHALTRVLSFGQRAPCVVNMFRGYHQEQKGAQAACGPLVSTESILANEILHADDGQEKQQGSQCWRRSIAFSSISHKFTPERLLCRLSFPGLSCPDVFLSATST